MPEATIELLTPKEANPLLTSFNEVSAPVDISWWPQTLGWQLLLLIVILVIVFRIYIMIRHYFRNAYRRGALQLLAQLSDELTDLQKLPQLIRKTSLYAFERESICLLTGEKWEHWLDAQCPGASFSVKHRGQLSLLAYAPEIQLTPQQLNVLKQQIAFWIKHHRGLHD